MNTSVAQGRGLWVLRFWRQFPEPKGASELAMGTLRKEKRRTGESWVYRWQTTRASDGKRVENTRVVGSVKEIGSAATAATAAWREVAKLGFDLLDAENAAGRELTFNNLATHYREKRGPVKRLPCMS